jgi:NADPH:quinone reductase-like Zn-dependent oxidoreductase
MLEVDLLQHRLARQFPLEEIAAAHEFLESGTAIGKVLINTHT